eukprot:TRINITY_DN5640_c0_g1_i2.p1 TRINITY_DN5640_c0_g1~~TRINITY_DN5640_c0_g1_i2.p1  ORF type:complete len:383 (+),score=99.69 TRINITY_DN5640_c0_g1_i2:145-1293(+)
MCIRDSFKERLKQPKSLALYESMMKFTKEVQSGTIKVKDLKTTVQQFIAQFEEDFQNLWAESEEDYQNNCEAIEGIITKLLYPKLIVLYDTERDRRLSYLFKVFDFIELSHLEAGPDIDAETFAHAVENIRKIDQLKKPWDKLIVIVNCCKLVSSMVFHAKEDDKPTGADDFLPVLIYVVLKAKPANIATNIEFIKDFRSAQRLRGLDEYYFTAFQSALEFIEQLDASKLKIDPEEFERKVEDARARIDFVGEVFDVGALPMSPSREESIADTEERSTKSEGKKDNGLAEMNQSKNVIINSFLNLRYVPPLDSRKLKFATRTADSLLVSEVPDLLAEHKQILAAYNDLRRRLEDTITKGEGMLRDVRSASVGKESRKFLGLF